ncbi:hypothetical protein V8D89_005991 [Ganoderma adspersum]
MTFWGYLFTRDASTSPSSAASGKSVTTSLTDRTHIEEQASRSGLRTALIFSAILIPCAAIPYVLLRRQCLQLTKEITVLRVANESFAREMRHFTTGDAAKSQKSVEEIVKAVREHKVKLQANATVLAEVKESLEAARARMDELQGKVEGAEKSVLAKVLCVERSLSKAQRVEAEQLKMRVEWQEEMKLQLVNLAAESTRWRSTVAEDMKDTGMSLANFAGFVEEVERREGWAPLPNDGRGIDWTRKLARRLSGHGQPEFTTSEEQDDQAEKEMEPNPSNESKSGKTKQPTPAS